MDTNRRAIIGLTLPVISAVFAVSLSLAAVAEPAAGSGDEALARLREERYDAITLDILLPGIDVNSNRGICARDVLRGGSTINPGKLSHSGIDHLPLEAVYCSVLRRAQGQASLASTYLCVASRN